MEQFIRDLFPHINTVEFLFVVILIFAIVIFFAALLLNLYIIKATAIYLLSKKAKMPRPWLAFIPVLQGMKAYNLAGFSEKTFLVLWILFLSLCLTPLKALTLIALMIRATVNIYIRIRTAQNFGGNLFVVILNVLFEPFVLAYFDISKKQFSLKPEWQPLKKFLHELNFDTNF